MEYKELMLKEGVNLHIINTDKFKTNLISIFLTTKLTREEITQKALILSILRRGTQNLKTQEEINKKLEELYGAECSCGVDKNGDNHISKFYIEAINDSYIPENYNVFEKSIEILFEIIFNPLTENGAFKEEYFNSEKENLKQIIEARKDNKRAYSTIRCIEEMYKNEPYGLYKFGYIEDLEKITNKDLYDTYKKMINNAKIDIFISGKLDQIDVERIISNNKYIKEISPRKNEVENTNEKVKITEPKTIIETSKVAQGNLSIGMKIEDENQENKIIYSIYNAILGGGANSKLFQNVREKASLAYSAGSMYIKTKNAIIIKCGIEPENYEKTLQIVKQQIEDIKNGKFDNTDLKNATELVISSFKSMQDEQDSEISYYFNKELSNEKISVDEYLEKVQKVTLEDIKKVAQNVKVDTIYFLTSEEQA